MSVPVAMRTSGNPHLAFQNAVGGAKLRSMSGLGEPFNWNAVVDSAFKLTDRIITTRPAAGTAITQTAGGGLQVVRQSPGAPINYSASNTQVGGNLAAGLGTGQISPNLLLIGGAGVVVLLIVMMGRR
jgi:hypothetical protein